MGSILHALEVPPYGGDTLWANQYLAFETLSPGLQQTLRGLTGVHSARDAYSPKMQAIHDQFDGMTRADERDGEPTQAHPAVRVHAETGREALYLNQQYTIGLDGWWPHEAKTLARLRVPARDASRVHVPVALGAGDVAFWDNRCVQHMVMADVDGHRRAMHRTTVAGEAPIPPCVTDLGTRRRLRGRARPHGVREPARVRRDDRDVQPSALRARSPPAPCTTAPTR